MGGSNEKENIVRLTAKEHYIAHRLLYKIYRTPQLAFALKAMSMASSRLHRSFTSRQYEHIRLIVNEAAKGRKLRPLSEEHKRKLSQATKGRKCPPRTEEHARNLGNSKRGKPLSEEHKRRISEGLLGRIPWNKNRNMPRHIYTPELSKKLSIALMGVNTWTKGVPKSEDHKKKISAANKGKPKPKVQCSVCGMYAAAGNLKRWHAHI